jgi:DNA-binding CsgD family transcriptional regulator
MLTAGNSGHVGLGGAPLKLVGREAERARLQCLLEKARKGLSAAMVVRGVAGIGKTTLVDDLGQSAAGFRTLRIAGIESELELPYAALHALLLPHLERADRLPGPQRDAIGTAFGLVSGPAPNPFLVGMATLTLLADVAQSAPLLCTVDDAQWLDQASAQVLAFVARRILADQIVVVLCVRDPVAGGDRFEGLPELYLGSLGEPESLALLVERVGRIDRRVAQRVLSASGGNPLALIEFAGELSPAQLVGDSLVDEPLSLSARLEAAFARRVQALPASAQTVLLLASACTSGEPWRLWQAAAALGIHPDEALESELAEYLSLDEPIGFRHPLVRSAIYGSATPSQRRQVHQALAQVTDHVSDADRWAGHLAAAAPHPDERVAAEVERAAGRAHARGGYPAEATLLVRASRLTPDPARAAARSLAGAEAALLGGDAPRALAILGDAEGSLSTPWLRAESLRVRAGSLAAVGRLAEAPYAFATAAKALEPLDPRAARVAWVGAVSSVVFTGGRAQDITTEEIALGGLAAPFAPGDRPTVDDRLLEAFAVRFTAGYVPAAPMLRDVLTEMSAADHPSDTFPGQTLLVMLAAQDLWDAGLAELVLRRLVRRQRDESALLALHFAYIVLQRNATWAGRLGAAATHGAAAAEIEAALGGHTFPDVAGLETAALRGDEAAVRARADELRAIADLTGIDQLVVASQLGCSVVAVGRGHYGEAMAAGRSVFDEDPVGYGTQVLPDLVEAAARAGDAGLAIAALERLTERAETSGTPWALGLLNRSQGVSSAGPAADAHFVAAVDFLGRAAQPLDLARAHLLYGEHLRRDRRPAEARDHLQQAYDMFATMGIDGFIDRTGSELQAAGGQVRPRTRTIPTRLTPQEAHVARLAASGATNREIAAETYISQATVAYHLTKAYRKLQVSSRRQLARALATSTPDTG